MGLSGASDLKSLGMVLVPSLGYVFQYKEIYSSNDAEGFSNLIWFVLLIAYITRVFWWMWSASVSNTVLSSSVFMIVCQLLLLEITVRLKKKEVKKPEDKESKQNVIVWYFMNFWNWHGIIHYIRFLSFLILACAIGTYLYKGDESFAKWLGNVSTVFEAMLAVPQLVKNFMRRSTKGVTIILILWLILEDIFKMYYYYTEGSPIQLFLCSAFQMLTDTTILLQFFIFGDR